MTVADVLQRPTVAGLAAGGDDALFRLPPLVRTIDAGQLLASAHPVSWNQSQLLTVHLVDGATAAYNIPMITWLVGRLAGRASATWHSAAADDLLDARKRLVLDLV